MHNEFNGGMLIHENGNPRYSLKQSSLQPKGKTKFILLNKETLKKNKNNIKIKNILPSGLKFMVDIFLEY